MPAGWCDVAAKMIGLPPVFWHEHGVGGGVLQVCLCFFHSRLDQTPPNTL